jgi:hypothetical protein
MNISQIRFVAWGAAGLLAAGLAGYVATFVTSLPERQAMPEAETMRGVLSGVQPVAIQDTGQVAYADVQRLFHTLNWTGAPKAPPPVTPEKPVEVSPQSVPVAELVRVLWVQVDLADPQGSAVFLRYKPRAQVPNTGIGGYLLREGDSLAAPQDHAILDAITIEGVVFRFKDEAREKETLTPAEFDAKAEIVKVGPDGVVVPEPNRLIPRIGGEPFRPGKTTPLGRDKFVLGSEDLEYAERSYTEILSQDMRLRQHRDPRTGRYDGIEITDVTPGSFAERHGAQQGDVVRSINGHPVSSTQEAIHFVRNNRDRYTTWEVVIDNRGRTRTVTYHSPGN